MAYLLQPLKNLYHFFQGHLWRVFYGLPDRQLKIYGVTGTNGKTTTCYLLTSILSEAHSADRVGMLSTVGIKVGRRQEVNKTKLTTLPSRQVYRYLRQMKSAGVRHVVLEITSHALDQRRLSGISLSGAIVLNIEREHLDYHRTIEAYARAKARIIDYLRPAAPLVGKADDRHVRKILDRARQCGVRIYEFTSKQAETVVTPLAGSVNRENALAATMLARALNISDAAINAGISKLNYVPGRMEWIETGKGFRVLIDYAVTPAALSRLYDEVRATHPGRILALLGAAGLRDRGKRPQMALTVARAADRLILTREDPWTEPEEQIYADLEQGLKGQEVNWEKVFDRREALRMLINEAQPGDVVVVTGKGAEEGMGIGRRIIPWNDKQVIHELLAEL